MKIWQVKNKSRNIDPHFPFFLPHFLQFFFLSSISFPHIIKNLVKNAFSSCIHTETQTRFDSLIHVLNSFSFLFWFAYNVAEKIKFFCTKNTTLKIERETDKKYVKSTGRKWNIQDSYSLMQCQLIIFTYETWSDIYFSLKLY